MNRLLLLAVLACGSNREAAPRPEPEPIRETPQVEAVPDAPSCEPGWASPFTPDTGQLNRNLAALQKIEAGELEAARTDLEALIAEAPGYDSARFNLACALAKLGLTDEARTHLEALLCADLPTNLPRARSDEDLSALRSEVDAIATRLLPLYRDTEGTPLVAFGGTLIERASPSPPNLHWSQSGLWTGTRFVPVGPRQQARERDGEPPLLASTIAGDLVIGVESVSSAAEAEYLPPLKVSVTRAFEGEELHARRYDLSQDEYFDVSVGAVDGRAWIGFESHFRGAPPPRREWIDDGSRLSATPTASMRLGMQTWAPHVDDTHVEVMRRRELRLEGTTLTLDRRHATNTLRAIEQDPWIVLHSYAIGDCGETDRYFVQMVERSSGRVRWEEAGEGQVLLRFHEGALWIQKNDALFVLSDPARNDRIALPAGLGLSSRWYAFNPMC